MQAPAACRAAQRARVAARAAAADEYIEDESFSLAKVSFGDILTPVGIVLMTFGFGSYFQLIPGSGFSGVALIYGFPVLLLGFALKYAQLEPVGCKTSKQALQLRESQMTDNLKQVREDCTRFRCVPAAASCACGALQICSKLAYCRQIHRGPRSRTSCPHALKSPAALRVQRQVHVQLYPTPCTPESHPRMPTKADKATTQHSARPADTETSSTSKRRLRASSSSAAPPACRSGSARGCRGCGRRR